MQVIVAALPRTVELSWPENEAHSRRQTGLVPPGSMADADSAARLPGTTAVQRCCPAAMASGTTFRVQPDPMSWPGRGG